MAGLPRAVDDSYREAPLAALDDSHSGLNLGMASLTVPHSEARQGGLLAGAPKDFNFLFERFRASSAVSDISMEDRSQLNVDAPEFIPTLSHDCPVVGFCEVPENATSISAASAGPKSPRSSNSRPRGASSCDPVFECATPTKGNTRSGSFNSNMSAPPSSTKKHGAARKRHAAATMGLKVPAVKRTRSEERHEGGKARMEMPELTQEEWENRRATRFRAIEFGKATPEYARYLEMRALGEAEPSGLATPDALDRSISKRQWKYIVQLWRTKLKHLYSPGSTDGGETGSTGSADEGLSIITGVTDEADANSTIYGDDGSSQ